MSKFGKNEITKLTDDIDVSNLSPGNRARLNTIRKNGTPKQNVRQILKIFSNSQTKNLVNLIDQYIATETLRDKMKGRFSIENLNLR